MSGSGSPSVADAERDAEYVVAPVVAVAAALVDLLLHEGFGRVDSGR